jgi:hypothetical protein
MSIKIVPLTKRKPEPDPALIDMLEDILNQAKNGNIENLALVAIDTEESVFTWNPSGIRRFAMLGAISSLMIRYQNKTLGD